MGTVKRIVDDGGQEARHIPGRAYEVLEDSRYGGAVGVKPGRQSNAQTEDPKEMDDSLMR